MKKEAVFDQFHIAPDEAKYRLAETRATAPALAPSANRIVVQSDTVEVVISEPRLLSWGSQFGHVAIIVDEQVYSRSSARYFTTSRSDYIHRNAYRNSVGYLIRVSPNEREAIKGELERRVHLSKADPGAHEYSLFDNSCSSNVADVLKEVGIVAHDPRWLVLGIISPADIVTGLNHSKRVVRKTEYPKIR